MKIYKTSESSVLDKHLYSIFVSSIKNGSLFWTHELQKFKHVSNIGDFNVFEKNFFAMVGNGGYNKTPDFRFNLKIFQNKDKLKVPSKWIAELWAVKGSNKKIIIWGKESQTDDCVYGDAPGYLKMFLNNIGLKTRLPLEENQTLDGRYFSQLFVDGETTSSLRDVWGYKRLTKSKSRYENARSLEIWIEKIQSVFNDAAGADEMYNISYRAKDLETEIVNKVKKILGENGDLSLNATNIVESYHQFIDRAKQNGFVDKDSFEYIPEDYKEQNWNFTYNQPQKQEQQEQQEKMNEEENTEPMSVPKLRKILSQDFSGYYSGDVPNPESFAGYIGTPSVEASQIKAVFGGADEAIHLVNKFNGDLLKNIAFIFNFSQGGAYGVYLSEMDRAIKTKFLARQLTQKGYEVVEENGFLTANPKAKEIPREQIQKDIDSLYGQINQKGGTAIGINMAKIIESARNDAGNIPSSEKDFLFQQLAILHLGETVVHEAIHAKGSHSEGPSESAETQFVNWYLPQLNEKYHNHLKSNGKEDEYTDIIVGSQKRHASGSNWYKIAQMYSGLFNGPVGSDLSGRMQGKRDKGGVADYSMMLNQQNNTSIESRLGKQFMWPLAKDIDPDKDSTELQLRKSFGDPNKETNMSTEELLEKDRMNEDVSYKITEKLLQEKRPSPLMVTIKKDASMQKIATLFGWYNNLEISDGNTIPGLGDRVMEWDDRDEDFAWSDEEIRSQPRYNPEFDELGKFYYQYIEPRFKPELWDDMNSDLGNTHPARRFAEEKSNEDHDIEMLKNILLKARNVLSIKKVKSIRFIVSEDLLAPVTNFFSNYHVVVIPLKDGKENIFALWVFGNLVTEDDVIEAEKYFSENDESLKLKAEELTGIIKHKINSIKEIMSCLNAIYKQERLSKIYMVGEAAREFIFNEDIKCPVIHLVCEDKDDAIIYGQLIANKFSEDYNYSENNDLVMRRSGYKICFHCGENNETVDFFKKVMRDNFDFDNSLVLELINKDFTINMIAYSICDSKIYDPFNSAKDINEKILKTKLDSNLVLDINKDIYDKAKRMIADGFKPCEELELAINNFCNNSGGY